MSEAVRQLEIQAPIRKRKLQVVSRPKKETKAKSRKRVRINAERMICNFLCTVLVASSIGLLIYMAMGYNRLASINREISKTQREISSLEAEHDYLKIQLEPYVAKGRIENLAKSQLGMVYPNENQITTVSLDNSVTTSTVARTQEINQPTEPSNDNAFASITKLFTSIFR